MHVVLTPSWYPDARSPHNGSFFREQAQMLRRAGMRVGVIALQPVSLWQARPPLEASEEDGIAVVRGSVPIIPKGVLPGDRTAARAVAQRALGLYERVQDAAAGRPEVVHAHSVFVGLHVGALAAARWGAGLVLTEHRPSSTDRSRAGWRYRALRRDMRAVAVRSSVSTPFSQCLTGYWGLGPWDDIALPVPEEYFEQHRPPSGRRLRICHVSHLDPGKRVPETLAAVAQAGRQLSEAGHQAPSLTVVGGQDTEVAPLRDLADSLGIGERTTFTGRVAHAEVARHMADADVFVLASDVEAGGTVLAEAQALGCVCAATPTWAGRFMVEPATGVVLSHRTLEGGDALVAELTRALVDIERVLSQDSPRWRPEAIRARARRRFSEETFTATSRRFYDKALKARPAQS